MLVNSVLSDAKHGAKFMTTDIRDYFLATPMVRADYIEVQYKLLHKDMKLKYNL